MDEKELTTNTLSWDICPPEIIGLILNNLDLLTLINCTAVCKSWNLVVKGLLKKDNNWKKFCKEFACSEDCMTRKSTLAWNSIYRNKCLWRKVAKAQEFFDFGILIKHIMNNIHVYKDKLIVIYSKSVKYFQIEPFELVYSIPLKCKDFNENDSMHVQHTIDNNLYLYGKNHKNEAWNLETSVPRCFLAANVPLWFLSESCCYFVDRTKSIWAYKWKNEWKSTLLARYHGTLKIHDLKVSSDGVFIYLENDDIYKVDMETKQLLNQEYSEGPIQKDCVFFTVYQGLATRIIGVQNRERTVLTHGSISGIVDHGEYIIVGYLHSKIEIYRKDYLLQGSTRPIKNIHLRVPVNIFAMDIHETVDSHSLFISSGPILIKVTFNYPARVKKTLPPALANN